MKETAIFDLPYPEETDPPDGAAQIKAAAERVEELLATIEGLILGAPAPGNLIVVNGTSDPIYKAATGDVTNNSAGVFSIGNEKVATAAVQNLAVTAAKLAAEAVETGKLANLAVTEGKLAALAVSAGKLAAEAVETGKIKALAVTEAKIAAEAIATAKIADLAVTKGKLATAVQEELQSGGQAKRLLVAAENNRAVAGFGAFATPMLLTLPAVKANQIVEIMCFGWAKATVEGTIRISVTGNTSVASAALPRTTNTFFTVKSTNSQGTLNFDIAANATPVTPLDKTTGAGGTGADVLRVVNKEDRVNYTVELQGTAPSGTLTITQTFLIARVWG